MIRLGLIHWLLGGGVGLLAGCGSAPRDRVAQRTDAGPAAGIPAPAESLVLRGSDGVEVWFTQSRPDSGPTGLPCTERLLEVRRDGRRIPVPLLYTGAAPQRINDSMLRARVWLHCRPLDSYLVNLQTGLPTREP